MNLAHLLDRIARQEPTRPALLHGPTPLCDYGAWGGRCARLAGALRQRGLQPGDRIALLLHNHPAYLELMWAAWWAGLAIVPINAKLHAREAEWILGHSGASLCFVDAETAAGLDAPCPLLTVDTPAWAALFDAEPWPIEAREGDDLAWLFYTSGTTGRPKGVMLGHRQLLTMGLCYFTDVDAIDAMDTTAYAAPMSHGAGLYTIPHVIAGARHLVPASGGFDAAELFTLAATLGRVSLFAAPTMVLRLVNHAEAHGLDGTGFKTIVYGGAPMYAADIERALRQLGPRFVQIYGQGESPMTITALSRRQLADLAHPQRAQRLASVGVAQSAVQVRIADADGRPLSTGEAGEVLVRGDTVMSGYWRDEAASAATLCNGWLHTGDVGALDQHGFLTLLDRSKDVVISGGSNIYPREVEEVLLLDPSLAEACVIGAPDPHWGEIVVAFVVPRAGATPDPVALDALCLAHIARFKRPKHYRVLSELPKNHYGKVLKTELRRLWAAGAAG